MKRRFFIVAAILIGSQVQTQVIQQQKSRDAAVGDTTEYPSGVSVLDPVVITANKFPQKQSGTGKLISVINEEQIRESAGKDLAQVLNEQAGIVVNGATSNPGTYQSLLLQGATTAYTLILLDGVPLNDPSGVGGTFDLRLLSLDNILRIEILKGSQSTLYGSNAVAGVINIISKKPSGTRPHLAGLLTYGSYNSFKGNANVSQQTKWLDYDVNYTYNRTSGISEARDTAGFGDFDKDGFVQHAIQTSLGIKLNSRFTVSPYYRFTQFKGKYDDAAFTDGKSDSYTASLLNAGLTGRLLYGTGTLHFNYGYDFTRRDYFGSFFEFLTKGKFHQGEVYVDQRLNQHLNLVSGLNFQSFSVDGRDTVNTMISAYGSLLYSVRDFHLELAGRFNNHNRYGNNGNYSVNPSYWIHKTVKVFVNLSTGFRPPTLNEMLPSQFQDENFDLKPEKSTNVEAGIHVWSKDKKFSALANYFSRHLKDAIVYTTAPVTFNGLYLNRDRQHDHGGEVVLEYRPGEDWSLRFSYDYVDGQGKQKLPTGKDSSFHNLIRRPKSNAHLFVRHRICQGIVISSSLQLTGKRTDNYFDPSTFNTVPVSLKAYALWNVYVEFDLPKAKCNFFVDAKNLANNKDYYEIYGYGVTGLNITGGFRFQL